jgi:proteic killer suppression protein
MELATFRSKALERFWRTGTRRGLPVENDAKVRRMLSFLAGMSDVSEFLALPQGRPHALGGDRAGTYSVSVSGNWRLTFTVSEDAIHDLDLEDYH